MNEPRFQIAVIKGDGIGIDVSDAAIAAELIMLIRSPLTLSMTS